MKRCRGSRMQMSSISKSTGVKPMTTGHRYQTIRSGFVLLDLSTYTSQYVTLSHLGSRWLFLLSRNSIRRHPKEHIIDTANYSKARLIFYLPEICYDVDVQPSSNLFVCYTHRSQHRSIRSCSKRYLSTRIRSYFMILALSTE